MNLWMTLLAIAIIAMVVGPIMMLQPSSAQRAEEALRKRARELGLRIGIISLPRQATDTDAPLAAPVYYLPHAQPDSKANEWLLLRTPYDHETHFMGKWQWHGACRATMAERQQLQLLLSRFPMSVSAVGAGPQGYCCYWSERGGIKTLDQLKALLQILHDARMVDVSGLYKHKPADKHNPTALQ